MTRDTSPRRFGKSTVAAPSKPYNAGFPEEAVR